jgi:TusA-related sulfurtransferase
MRGTTMSVTTRTSLDMRGKSITTFIACETARRLADLTDGEALELLVDASDEIDNDLAAWCRCRGQELAVGRQTDGSRQHLITKSPLRATGKRFAAVISDAGLEELLSPLGFALAAALKGSDVWLYSQGPAVRVLAEGFTEHLQAQPALQPLRPGRAHQGRPHSRPREGPPAAGAGRPPLHLRAVNAALQDRQERPGFPGRDRG